MGEKQNASNVDQRMEVANQTDVLSEFSQHLNHWAWKLHTYGFASIYVAFTVQVLFVLVRKWKVSSEHKKQHVRVMSIELILSGILRAFNLFWDPYFVKDSDNGVQDFTKCSWSAGTILITSAFSILLLILLESTRISLGPSKFRKLSVLLLITAANFCLLVVTRVIYSLVTDARAALIASWAIFSLWGLAFCVGFAVTSVRMWRNVKFSLISPSRSDRRFAEETRRLKRLLIRTAAASVLSGMMFVLMSFIAVSDYMEFVSDAESMPDFWAWYGVQTSLRILELLVMFLIFEIALKAKTKQDPQLDRQKGKATSFNSSAAELRKI